MSVGAKDVLYYGWKMRRGTGADVDVEWERSFIGIDLKVSLVGPSLQSSWGDKYIVE